MVLLTLALDYIAPYQGDRGADCVTAGKEVSSKAGDKSGGGGDSACPSPFSAAPVVAGLPGLVMVFGPEEADEALPFSRSPEDPSLSLAPSSPPSSLDLASSAAAATDLRGLEVLALTVSASAAASFFRASPTDLTLKPDALSCSKVGGQGAGSCGGRAGGQAGAVN